MLAGFVSDHAVRQVDGETVRLVLSDPRELLSVGTFPLAYRQSACNHMPDGALRSMGAADGFVSVQERGRIA